MFFATENKPKGPKVKRLEKVIIDLSGTKLKISVPYGNSYDLPDPAGTLVPKCNIYDITQYSSLKPHETGLAEILQRHYRYSGFLGENLGGLIFSVFLWCCKDQQVNLFSTDNFKKHLNNYFTESHRKWNEKADESCQLYVSDEYKITHLNQSEYLQYEIRQTYDVAARFSYVTAITDNCYIEFNFHYISVRDTTDRWYQMAKEIEHLIMNSVTIELTDSAITAKASSI